MASTLLSLARERMICYPPHAESNKCARVVESLAGIGVSLEDLEVYSKGTDSIILLSKPTKTVFKVARLDSNANMCREGMIMLYVEHASRRKIAPRALAFTREFVHMELIRGAPLKSMIELNRKIEACQLCLILGKVLELDMIGVDHGELSRPHKHIIFREPDGEPMIIDFGRASLSRRPKNLTSTISFFLNNKNVLSASACEALVDALNSVCKGNRYDPYCALREYKRNMAVGALIVEKVCKRA